MSKYLVFEMPERMIEVEASNADIARRKYLKLLKGINADTVLVISPSANTRVTIDEDKTEALWRIGVERLK